MERGEKRREKGPTKEVRVGKGVGKYNDGRLSECTVIIASFLGLGKNPKTPIKQTDLTSEWDSALDQRLAERESGVGDFNLGRRRVEIQLCKVRIQSHAEVGVDCVTSSVKGLEKRRHCERRGGLFLFVGGGL